MAESSLYTTSYTSPLGTIQITGTEAGINSILFSEQGTLGSRKAALPASLQKCVTQLEEYFNGTRREFDLPLAPAGTAFQQQVWKELGKVAFGKTASYLEIARKVSTEKAIRAVGAANGRNPLCIVVPCHRIIGSDGSLVGYAGGLWRKEWLLLHEGVIQPTQQLTLFS